LDEQVEANGKLQAQLQKAAADAQQLKTKYEKDITIITEELEGSKLIFTQLFLVQCELKFLHHVPISTVFH